MGSPYHEQQRGEAMDAAAWRAASPLLGKYGLEEGLDPQDGHVESEELSDAEINRIDRAWEAAEQDAIEDETQPGGPLWDVEAGRPYPPKEIERMCHEAYVRSWVERLAPEAEDWEAGG
jgi:hypothetical protein